MAILSLGRNERVVVIVINRHAKKRGIIYRTSYRRCLELQARLLAKTVTAEIEAYTPFFSK